jgi:hypothetical protein
MGAAKGLLALILVASFLLVGCARPTPTPTPTTTPTLPPTPTPTPTPTSPATPKISQEEIIGIVQAKGVPLLPKTKGGLQLGVYIRGSDEWQAGDFRWSATYVGNGVWEVVGVAVANMKAVWRYYEDTGTVSLESTDV